MGGCRHGNIQHIELLLPKCHHFQHVHTQALIRDASTMQQPHDHAPCTSVATVPRRREARQSRTRRKRNGISQTFAIAIPPRKSSVGSASMFGPSPRTHHVRMRFSRPTQSTTQDANQGRQSDCSPTPTPANHGRSRSLCATKRDVKSDVTVIDMRRKLILPANRVEIVMQRKRREANPAGPPGRVTMRPILETPRSRG